MALVAHGVMFKHKLSGQKPCSEFRVIYLSRADRTIITRCISLKDTWLEFKDGLNPSDAIPTFCEYFSAIKLNEGTTEIGS